MARLNWKPQVLRRGAIVLSNTGYVSLEYPKTIWQRQTFALLAEEAVVADAWVAE